MEFSMDVTGIDMNDAANLSFYTQLIRFQMNPALEETLFQSPNPLQQRTIQSWAHALGFEFEYSLASRRGRVVRATLPNSESSRDFHALETFETSSTLNMGTTSEIQPNISNFLSRYEFGDLTDLGQFDDMFQGLGSVTENPEHLTEGVPRSDAIPYETNDKDTQTDIDSFLPDASRFPLSYARPNQTSALPYQSSLIYRTSSVASTKRKAVRAGQACDSCRSMKAKCDGKQPRCTFCNEKDISCNYRDPYLQTWRHSDEEIHILKTALVILGSILDCEMKGELKDDLRTLLQSVLPGIQTHDDLGRFANVVYDPVKKHLGFFCISCKSQLTLQSLLLNPQTSCSTYCGTFANPDQEDFPDKKSDDATSQVPDSRQQGESGDNKPVDRLDTTSERAKNHSHQEQAADRMCQDKYMRELEKEYGGDFEETDPPIGDYENQPQELASPIGSPMSIQSERGRKPVKSTFGSRSNFHSPASSGYQEIVFDSKSPRVRSPASASSGRRGPLDTAARAAMKAVKALRACWRCKFLRNACDVDNPCLACPKASSKTGSSNWPLVGCKRGSFKEEMAPLYLCPVSNPEFLKTLTIKPIGQLSLKIMNERSRAELDRRSKILGNIVNAMPAEQNLLNSYLQNPEIGPFIPEAFLETFVLTKPSHLPAKLIPLEECVAAIIYEVTLSTHSRFIITDGRPNELGNTVTLLRATARHQAITENDELVAQSLICLRACLEALRFAQEYFVHWSPEQSHWSCRTSSCEFECITNLNLHLERYLEELCRVFFNKENMRLKESWWLSTFYSFCIQGIVRRALKELKTTPHSGKAIDEYLHLALRLFTASSGTYDPLIRNFALPGKEKEFESTLVADFQAAQTAVQQASWSADGVESSSQYLKNLFGDEGADLLSVPQAISKVDSADSQAQNHNFSPTTFQPLAQSQQFNGSWLSSGQIIPQSPRPGSRPYRASSLSSVESISDMHAGPASPYTANTSNIHTAGDLYHDFHEFIQPSSKSLSPSQYFCNSSQNAFDMSYENPQKQTEGGELSFAPSMASRNIPQKYPFDLQPCSRATLTSMESSTSEYAPGASADIGVYTCTYHGCTLQFETPAKLQRHKRVDHHNSTSVAAKGDETSMNTYNGPHKCERINPSTGKPCNAIFSRPYDLTRHEDTIHNSRKQKVRCHLCTEEKSFSRHDALTRHFRVVHPDHPELGRRERRGDRD